MKKNAFLPLFQKRIVICVSILLFLNVCFLGLLYFIQATKQVKTITVTKNGFEPESITIQKGDTIQFRTTDDADFWPASNLHPSHTLYPEFDSGRPIPSQESWAFTFTKAGTWTFHDHLAPHKRGTIIVSPLQNQVIPQQNCEGEKTTKKLQCWEEQISSHIANGNIEDGFAIITALYEKDPMFAANCHDFTHRIGEQAAVLFQKGTEIPLSDKASYCAYGFYHGFMTKLLENNASSSQLTTFCDRVTRSQTAALSDACYHGVGHGALTDASEKNNKRQDVWVASAIDTCEKVGETPLTRSRCASGIFMEIAVLMAENKFPIDSSKPLALCELQRESYQLDCYTQLNGAVSLASKGDMAQGMTHIAQIVNDLYAKEATITYIAASTTPDPSDLQRVLTLCRNVQQRLHLSCVKGISLSYMLRGTPQKEYVQAIQICNNNYMSDMEQEACLEQVFSHSKTTYSQQVFESICEQVTKHYQKLCHTYL